jgi:IS5 family transposase
MSLPDFSTQAELFSTAGLSASLFAPTDRYRLFAKLVYPRLAANRAALEKCYCSDNGRVALEPVLMLGTSILQYVDGVPDRQAVEMLRYHAGWNFALNRQLGDEVFHPTSLVNFRHRLEEHQQSTLGFTIILNALVEAGLVSRQSRQRLDSTQMFGRVARMSRLDCVRESLRLALKELEGALTPEERPLFWLGLWERYVDSQTDYRAGSETLARKLGESGTDAWQLLEWLREPTRSELAKGPQAQLLARVFAEQFELQTGKVAPAAVEKIPVSASSTPAISEALEARPPDMTVSPEANQTPVQTVTSNPITPSSAEEPKLAVVPQTVPQTPQTIPAPNVDGAVTDQPKQDQAQSQTAMGGVVIQPKDKQQLTSERVQNPHDPEATYSVKGQGEKKKEHVGYKVQVAETVCELELEPGEPTRNFLAGIVPHLAYQSDEAGALKMEAEQAAMGLEKPPVQYVDGAYVSAQGLATAKAEGREIIGPAPGAPDNNNGRFTTERFEVKVEERTAICPAGQQSTQCSRLEEAQSGRVNYRFEWSIHCAECPLREQCVGPKQKHRTIVVGAHHSALQTRRLEQQSDAFKQRMKHRNAIEGTQSELVRGHGLRRARYRGLAKVKLQSYFIGAACNVKRWVRHEGWKLQRALSAAAARMAISAGN